MTSFERTGRCGNLLRAARSWAVWCALIAYFGCAHAHAAPPLTTVQDILYNADGSLFNGLVTISWQSFEAADGSNIAARTLTARIVNGLLRVQLVPTTNALSAASYHAVYNSGGTTQFAEDWSIPPSNVPIRVSDIRISGAGTTVGGVVVPPADTAVTISQVTGLAANLAQVTAALAIRPIFGIGFTPSRAAVFDAGGTLNGAVGNLSDCLHVDGTSGVCGGSTPTGSSAFVDGETPAGTLDGTNASFMLANSPAPPASLVLFLNGLLMRQGLDFTLNGAAIVFNAPVPQPGDVVQASYRVVVNIPNLSFVDAEVPAGTIDGSNLAFVLSQAPSPAASLALYRNGLRLAPVIDYTLTGTQLVFAAGAAPQPTDVVQAFYRTVPQTN